MQRASHARAALKKKQAADRSLTRPDSLDDAQFVSHLRKWLINWKPGLCVATSTKQKSKSKKSKKKGKKKKAAVEEDGDDADGDGVNVTPTRHPLVSIRLPLVTILDELRKSRCAYCIEWAAYSGQALTRHLIDSEPKYSFLWYTDEELEMMGCDFDDLNALQDELELDLQTLGKRWDPNQHFVDIKIPPLTEVCDDGSALDTNRTEVGSLLLQYEIWWRTHQHFLRHPRCFAENTGSGNGSGDTQAMASRRVHVELLEMLKLDMATHIAEQTERLPDDTRYAIFGDPRFHQPDNVLVQSMRVLDDEVTGAYLQLTIDPNDPGRPAVDRVIDEVIKLSEWNEDVMEHHEHPEDHYVVVVTQQYEDVIVRLKLLNEIQDQLHSRRLMYYRYEADNSPADVIQRVYASNDAFMRDLIAIGTEDSVRAEAINAFIHESEAAFANKSLDELDLGDSGPSTAHSRLCINRVLDMIDALDRFKARHKTDLWLPVADLTVVIEVAGLSDHKELQELLETCYDDLFEALTQHRELTFAAPAATIEKFRTHRADAHLNYDEYKDGYNMIMEEVARVYELQIHHREVIAELCEVLQDGLLETALARVAGANAGAPLSSSDAAALAYEAFDDDRTAYATAFDHEYSEASQEHQESNAKLKEGKRDGEAVILRTIARMILSQLTTEYADVYAKENEERLLRQLDSEAPPEESSKKSEGGASSTKNKSKKKKKASGNHDAEKDRKERERKEKEAEAEEEERKLRLLEQMQKQKKRAQQKQRTAFGGHLAAATLAQQREEEASKTAEAGEPVSDKNQASPPPATMTTTTPATSNDQPAETDKVKKKKKRKDGEAAVSESKPRTRDDDVAREPAAVVEAPSNGRRKDPETSRMLGSFTAAAAAPKALTRKERRAQLYGHSQKDGKTEGKSAEQPVSEPTLPVPTPAVEAPVPDSRNNDDPVTKTRQSLRSVSADAVSAPVAPVTTEGSVTSSEDLTTASHDLTTNTFSVHTSDRSPSGYSESSESQPVTHSNAVGYNQPPPQQMHVGPAGGPPQRPPQQQQQQQQSQPGEYVQNRGHLQDTPFTRSCAALNALTWGLPGLAHVSGQQHMHYQPPQGDCVLCLAAALARPQDTTSSPVNLVVREQMVTRLWKGVCANLSVNPDTPTLPSSAPDVYQALLASMHGLVAPPMCKKACPLHVWLGVNFVPQVVTCRCGTDHSASLPPLAQGDFLQRISVEQIGVMKGENPDWPLATLLRNALCGPAVPCSRPNCGGTVPRYLALLSAPQVVSIALDWTTSASRNGNMPMTGVDPTTITACFAWLDRGVLVLNEMFGGLPRPVNAQLVTIVCENPSGGVAPASGSPPSVVVFSFLKNDQMWVRFDTYGGVRIIGDWFGVEHACVSENLRPTLLTFESNHSAGAGDMSRSPQHSSGLPPSAVPPFAMVGNFPGDTTTSFATDEPPAPTETSILSEMRRTPTRGTTSRPPDTDPPSYGDGGHSQHVGGNHIGGNPIHNATSPSSQWQPDGVHSVPHSSQGGGGYGVPPPHSGPTTPVAVSDVYGRSAQSVPHRRTGDLGGYGNHQYGQAGGAGGGGAGGKRGGNGPHSDTASPHGNNPGPRAPQSIHPAHKTLFPPRNAEALMARPVNDSPEFDMEMALPSGVLDSSPELTSTTASECAESEVSGATLTSGWSSHSVQQPQAPGAMMGQLGAIGPGLMFGHHTHPPPTSSSTANHSFAASTATSVSHHHVALWGDSVAAGLDNGDADDLEFGVGFDSDIEVEDSPDIKPSHVPSGRGGSLKGGRGSGRRGGRGGRRKRGGGSANGHASGAHGGKQWSKRGGGDRPASGHPSSHTGNGSGAHVTRGGHNNGGSYRGGGGKSSGRGGARGRGGGGVNGRGRPSRGGKAASTSSSRKR